MSRAAWRPISSMKRSRASGSSCAPDWSASTALVIAVTGVRSSCEALVTNSRSACAAALLLGDVGEHEHDEVGRRRGHADERDHRAVLALAPRLGNGRARHEQPLGEPAQRQAAVGLGQRRALLERDAGEQQLRVRVRELDAEVAVDREHALVHLLEHALEPVALGAQLLERAPSRLRMRSIVSARSPISSCRPASSSRAKSPCSIAAAELEMRLQAPRDQRRRDQPRERRGSDSPDRGLHDVVAEDRERRPVGRLRRVRDEHSGVVRGDRAAARRGSSGRR